MSLAGVVTPFVRLFENNDIPYAMIGGYAVAAWGELRATQDVDFLKLIVVQPRFTPLA